MLLDIQPYYICFVVAFSDFYYISKVSTLINYGASCLCIVTFGLCYKCVTRDWEIGWGSRNPIISGLWWANMRCMYGWSSVRCLIRLSMFRHSIFRPVLTVLTSRSGLLFGSYIWNIGYFLIILAVNIRFIGRFVVRIRFVAALHNSSAMSLIWWVCHTFCNSLRAISCNAVSMMVTVGCGG